MDSKHKFLRYILPEISYWMRYVMFDLEFQDQRSRSQYWYISFWILRHRFSTHRHQTYVSAIYATRDISFWMRYVLFDLEFQNQRSRSRYWYIFFWIQRHRYSTYRHQTQVSTIFTTINIILNVLRRLTLHFKVKGQGHDIDIYLFEFRDIDLVPIDTKHKFLRYILPEISYWMRFYDIYYQRYHIECVMSCLTLNFKVKDQGHNHETYFCEFPDIHLVIVDTKHKFLSQVLPEISYLMRYVMFDLEFQCQRSRSQYWHIIFWIPWHQFSGNRHKNYVSIASPSRDIE